MEKFIAAFKILKAQPKELKCLLVWNPVKQPWNNNQWLVTVVFSRRLIEARGLEVVHG